MDWGLLRPTSAASHRGLRDVLMLREPRVYYGAMALNGALRLTWILTLVRWPYGGAGVRVALPSALAGAEVFRRCMWNYFRVENEHVANAGSFRATASVPLPGAPAKAPAKDAAKSDPVALAAAEVPVVAAPIRKRVSFEEPLPRSPQHEERAGLLDADSAPEQPPPDAAAADGGVAAPLSRRKSSSDWDRTTIALRRVGTCAHSLHDDDDDEPHVAGDAAGAHAAAPASADAVAVGMQPPSPGGASPRRPPSRNAAPLGEHFVWDDGGEHSDDDDGCRGRR